jgi:hypothetical protein
MTDQSAALAGNSEFAPWQMAAGFGSNTGGQSAYGTVPQPVAPAAAPAAAIGSNLGNLAQLYQLAQGAGAASGAGGSANLNAALPGAGAAQQTALGVVNNDLAGALAPDVVNNIEQIAAERGVSTGAPGSPNTNAALLKDIGLTSQGLQQTGLQDLNALTAAAPTGPQFNPASQFLNPEEALGQENYNSQLESAPNPQAAAMANLTALNRGASGGGGWGGSAPATLPSTISTGGGAGGNVIAYGPGGGPGISAPFFGGGNNAQGGGNGFDPSYLIPQGDGTMMDFRTGETYNMDDFGGGDGGGSDEDAG